MIYDKANMTQSLCARKIDCGIFNYFFRAFSDIFCIFTENQTKDQAALRNLVEQKNLQNKRYYNKPTVIPVF